MRRRRRRRAARQLQARAGAVRRAATACISSTPTGKRYLDFVQRHRRERARLRRRRVSAPRCTPPRTGSIHISNLYATAPGERLAAALVAKSFASKVFFCNSGAEANEGAFKFARRWARTQGDAKHEIIALRGAFHGRLFGTLAATDRPSYRIPFRPLAPGIAIVERDIEDLAIALNPETVGGADSRADSG